MSGSEAPPKGLAPLRLGTAQGGAPAITISRVADDLAYLDTPRGCDRAGLTRSGAGVLSRWLEDFAGEAEKVPKLIAIQGILEEYSIARGTFYQWQRHAEFPSPVPVAGGGPIWEASAVRRWVRSNRPDRV